MKFAFIIQGEGRGHQTQAIALSEILIKNSHEVVVALVGSEKPNHIPELLSKSHFNVVPFISPGLKYNSKTKALSLKKTLEKALPKLGIYLKSIKLIKETIVEHQPDVIINFYDLLGGITKFLYIKDIPVYCIGHQYLLLNKHFKHPKGFWLDRLVVKINTKLTALGATKMLALSFSRFKNDKKIHAIPPLLRSEIKNYETSHQNYILVYLNQANLMAGIVDFAKKNLHIQFECFVENYEFPKLNNIHFNPISNQIFLEKMAGCSGIITTAGFETVCEGAYFNKPIYMVPIANHYEQYTNALDAKRARIGISNPKIDVANFLYYLKSTSYPRKNSQYWFSQIENYIVKEIEFVNNSVLV